MNSDYLVRNKRTLFNYLKVNKPLLSILLSFELKNLSMKSDL